MTTRDPYDVVVAFDDLYGEAPLHDAFRRPTTVSFLRPTPGSAARDVARRIWRRAQGRKVAPSPVSVVGLSYDPTYKTMEIEDVNYRIIGAYEPKYKTTDIADVTYRIIGDDAATPIFNDLQKKFERAMPAPKAVRLDTEETYAEFRSKRRAPYVAQLAECLRALEGAFAQHVADNHGQRLNDLEAAFNEHLQQYHGSPEELGDAVVASLGTVAAGGTPISLPGMSDKAQAWCDGREVLCTIRACDADGNLRLITSGAPLVRSAEEALGCAMEAGVMLDEETAAAVLETAQVLGAMALVSELCCVAPEVLDKRAPFVGAVTSSGSAPLAASMALLQRVQAGDRKARAEVANMARRGHEAMLTDAAGRLALGQWHKRARMS